MQTQLSRARVAVQFVVAPILFEHSAAGICALRQLDGDDPAGMLPVAAVIPSWFRWMDAPAGMGQNVARNAAFSGFCNWLIFSNFSGLGRENPENFPFVISKFSGLATCP
jgi:hypothetical protein